MPLAFVHVGGGWDELLVAVIALGVVWFAVRLARRKSASEVDDESAPDRPPVSPSR